jgi:hypothetical protein
MIFSKKRNCINCNYTFYSKFDLCNCCFKSYYNDKKCYAAGVLLTTYIDGEKYALLGRASKNKHPDRCGKLEFFGGCSELRETPKQTAIREIYEESLNTIKLNEDDIKIYNTYKNNRGRGYILYECEVKYSDIILIFFDFYLNLKNYKQDKNLEMDKLVLVKLEKLDAEKISEFTFNLLFNITLGIPQI